ncbi:uncharacterized protein DS421_14g453140 [Arachis hypogaea]|nr:uncharacterized protein DS421_14g453140 [Arachis hypogaea]
MPSQHPLDSHMYWYRSKFGERLNLSNLVRQKNDEGNQDMDEGNQDTDEGSQDMDDDNEEQEPHSPHMSPPNPLPQEQPQSSSQYVPQTQFTPSCYYVTLNKIRTSASDVKTGSDRSVRPSNPMNRTLTGPVH